MFLLFLLGKRFVFLRGKRNDKITITEYDTPVLIKKKESEANEIFVILKRKFEKGFTDTGD